MACSTYRCDTGYEYFLCHLDGVPMTPEELKAYREKHANSSGTLNGQPVENCCFWCTTRKFDLPVAYPCDVIKVLDELDKAEAHIERIMEELRMVSPSQADAMELLRSML